MTFPTNISNIFRFVILLILSFEIMFFLLPEVRNSDRVYDAIVKVTVFFTCVISYLNDKKKMLVISERGFLFEKMNLDERTLPEKFSFIYILIAILYNPIFTPFRSPTSRTIIHLLTIAFLYYKVWFYKKQFGDGN